MAMVAMKRPEEAIAAAADEKNGMVRYPCVAIAQHMLGKLEAADAALADLVNAYGDAGLYQQAQILSRWGREDEAMAILEKAMELGDSGLTYAYIDPTLDPLRGRDDFKRLLEALGFV
jgi:tetratricopeptide (TPR) repeat protein